MISQIYYKYMNNLIYRISDLPCLPPYTDIEPVYDDTRGATPCPDYDKWWFAFESINKQVPPVGQCFIGVAPFSCPSLYNYTDYVDEFEGYPMAQTDWDAVEEVEEEEEEIEQECVTFTDEQIENGEDLLCENTCENTV